MMYVYTIETYPDDWESSEIHMLSKRKLQDGEFSSMVKEAFNHCIQSKGYVNKHSVRQYLLVAYSDIFVDFSYEKEVIGNIYGIKYPKHYVSDCEYEL